MAIRRFFSGEGAEADARAFAAEVGGRIDGPYVYSGVEGFAAIYAEGRVLREYERNGYHDSDFYAVYWDGKKPVTVEYASTRGWTYANGATADATPEVLAEYEAYLDGAKRGYAAAGAMAAADVPHVGAKVKVVRALKRTAKGVEGIVFWIGRGRAFRVHRYGYGTPPQGPMRVGFKSADGETHWANFSSVAVVEYDAGGVVAAARQVAA